MTYIRVGIDYLMTCGNMRKLEEAEKYWYWAIVEAGCVKWCNLTHTFQMFTYDQEFFEVYLPTVVLVKRSEDMFVEGFGLAIGKELGVHIQEFAPTQLTIWTIPLETKKHGLSIRKKEDELSAELYRQL